MPHDAICGKSAWVGIEKGVSQQNVTCTYQWQTIISINLYDFAFLWDALLNTSPISYSFWIRITKDKLIIKEIKNSFNQIEPWSQHFEEGIRQEHLYHEYEEDPSLAVLKWKDLAMLDFIGIKYFTVSFVNHSFFSTNLMWLIRKTWGGSTGCEVP